MIAGLLAAPNVFGAIYMGYMTAGEPADTDAEVQYVNYLLGMTAPSTETGVKLPVDQYNNPLPSAKLHDFVRSSATDGTLSVSLLDVFNSDSQFKVKNYEYVLGKYDGPQGGIVVWYLQPNEEFTVPSKYSFPQDGGEFKEFGLSHVTAFNPVPEPSTMIAGALLLLPFAASTVRALRRKREQV